VFTINRRLEFDAGHRVYMHESKCNNIHGHRYVVEIECTGSLDNIGRVIDFSVVKKVCGTWIDDNLDHGMLLWVKDPLVSTWEQMGNQKFYVMNDNPTAENIAKHLYDVFNHQLDQHGVRVLSVLVHETPNCRAMYKE
jgi:6-pyruvoyltetrahydropterin/6-carboxytetrahydropterin synthase